MKIKIIYIDDDKKDLKKYRRKFGEDERTRDRFKIITMKSQNLLEEMGEVKKNNPELILVDFDLSMPDEDKNVNLISGLTLSTELKQNFPEVPIVLFTRIEKFKIEDYSRINRTVFGSLDDVVYKNELFAQNEKLDSFYTLAIGFKKLRESGSRKWKNLLKILETSEEDEYVLKLSDPPITSESEWSVSEAAYWIRNILIKYPGMLYNAMHSATFLGISEDAFLSNSIQEFFAEAKYSGVFTPPEGRWWKSRLQEIANSIMNEEEMGLPLREGFPLSLERNKGTKIERSRCVYSREFYPETVCYILHKPVKIKYSLSYRADSRPDVMDEARASFEAIRTSNEVNDELFDPLGKEKLENIRKMSKRR